LFLLLPGINHFFFRRKVDGWMASQGLYIYARVCVCVRARAPVYVQSVV
jgi:hypothetical protein